MRSCKVLSLTLCLVLLCGCFSGCSGKKENKHSGSDTPRSHSDRKVKNKFPDEFLDYDDPMICLTCTSYEPIVWGSDYWRGSTYTLCFNGDLIITHEYSISGEETTTEKVSIEDFRELGRLYTKVNKERPFRKMDYSATMDGWMWGYVSYDLYGNKYPLYGGYTYECEDMERMEDIVRSYELDHHDRAIRLFEGYYVCPDDDQQYIRFYKDAKDKEDLEIGTRNNGQPEVILCEEGYLWLEEDGLHFEYYAKVPDREYEPYIFTYSDDMNTLQNTGTGITYVRQN